MRIRIHAETVTGVPVQGIGPTIEADDHAGIVEAMHRQTAFTAELPLATYLDRVLDRVEGKARTPLPPDPAAAAVEFLDRLARKGRIAVLDDPEK